MGIIRRVLPGCHEPEYEALLVTDETMLDSVWFDDEDELIMRCFRYYGVRLNIEHFAWPLWRVLDYLDSTRIPYTMQVYNSAK